MSGLFSLCFALCTTAQINKNIQHEILRQVNGQMHPLTNIKQIALPLIMFSLVTNLTVLISPIFMMQVLDRVVPSGNIETLVLLLGLAAGAVAANAFVDYGRDLTLSRTNRWVEGISAPNLMQLPPQDRQDYLNQMHVMRQALSGSAATTALSVPWVPLFLIALALIHPLFLVLALSVATLNLVISLIGKALTGEKAQASAQLSAQGAKAILDSTHNRRQTGLIAVEQNLDIRMRDLMKKRHVIEGEVANQNAIINAAQGGIRLFVQLSTLALGAYLVVQGQISAGAMIGASIINAKTGGVFEQITAQFPMMKNAMGAYRFLCQPVANQGDQGTEITLLSGGISAKNLTYPRGGGAQPRLDRVSVDLAPGQCLAIVGDSGSGKTTLLNALAGLDPCPIGTVFLDESDIRTLSKQTIIKNLGYLPQRAELLAGTIAENIACFDAGAVDDRIVAAAKVAGVHGLISALPAAYDTDLSTHGYLLSAGQTQRVALARAIFQAPKYLFLDEPNALLDAQSERQLGQTLAKLKSHETTIIMVLHRSGIMSLADSILFLNQGRVTDFGPRAEVLSRMGQNKRRLQIPLNAEGSMDLSDWVTAQFTRDGDDAFEQKAILVASEMFNAARQNGKPDNDRTVTMTFIFVDETHCEISLSEARPTELDQKMPKIMSLVRHPNVSMENIPPDEMALVIVAQLAQSLEVSNHDNTSIFSAKLVQNDANSPAQPSQELH